jgi:uncharacterized ion transporter superfamily protein YfcC
VAAIVYAAAVVLLLKAAAADGAWLHAMSAAVVAAEQAADVAVSMLLQQCSLYIVQSCQGPAVMPLLAPAYKILQ